MVMTIICALLIFGTQIYFSRNSFLEKHSFAKVLIGGMLGILLSVITSILIRSILPAALFTIVLTTMIQIKFMRQRPTV